MFCRTTFASIPRLLTASSLLFSNSLFAEVRPFVLADIRVVETQDTSRSWLNGGLDSARFDDDSSSFQLGQVIVGADAELSDWWSLSGFASAYSDEGTSLGLNELFVTFHPESDSGYQLFSHIGAFYPNISLENTEDGWTPRTTISNSAINSWIAEEIKIIGAELGVARNGADFDSDWDIVTSFSVFYLNDPAGSLLSWRGWGIHDRQVHLGEDSIQFAELPVISEGGALEEQSAYFEPTLELDHRPGYSGSLNFIYAEELAIEFYRYDNRGDPAVLEAGQYAWHTRFNHIGLRLPAWRGLSVSGQYINGRTKMGRPNEPGVKVDFKSWFLLSEYTVGAWAFALRYDDFQLVDRDDTPMDDNDQEGHAWTLAARYHFNSHANLAVEYVHLDEENYGRRYLGQAIQNQPSVAQIAFQFRF